MENLAKFPASTEADVVCKSDILTKACAAAGGAETGSSEPTAMGVKATPTVSAHTSSWLAALHVNNNNNADKTYAVKEQQLHKCNNVVNPLNTFNNITTTNAPWPCDSCDTYQTIGGGTSTLNASTLLPRVTLNEEDEGGGIGGSGNRGVSSVGVGISNTNEKVGFVGFFIELNKCFNLALHASSND